MALNYAHLGNGITVWDTNILDFEANDYKIIAHISPSRNILLYHKITDDNLNEIINIALIPHINISTTQSDNVFYISTYDKNVISITHYYLPLINSHFPKTYHIVDKQKYLPVVIPKKEIIKKKIRKSPTPNSDKIGNSLKSLSDLDRLVQNKQCVVIFNKLFPAAIIYCWQYCLVKSYIERGIIFEYLKEY